MCGTRVNRHLALPFLLADAMIGSLGKGVVLKVSAVWFLPTIVGVVDRGRKVGCPLHVLLLSDIFIPLGQRHV